LSSKPEREAKAKGSIGKEDGGPSGPSELEASWREILVVYGDVAVGAELNKNRRYPNIHAYFMRQEPSRDKRSGIGDNPAGSIAVQSRWSCGPSENVLVSADLWLI